MDHLQLMTGLGFTVVVEIIIGEVVVVPGFGPGFGPGPGFGGQYFSSE